MSDQTNWQKLYRRAISSFYVEPHSGELMPALQYARTYTCEVGLLSGAAFLTHNDYERSIAQHIDQGINLFGIEVPTYVGAKVTNLAIASQRCCNWSDFDAFQTDGLFAAGLNVGVAILSDSDDWALVKHPDIVCLFDRL